MKKKLLLASLLLIMFLIVCGFDRNGQKVFDNADLLSQEEEARLQERAAALGEELSLDVVIVTTNDAEGKTATEFADDFFDYNGFGYEKEMGSGILYLIDMDNRQSTISTSGTAIERYSDREQNEWQDELTGYLRSGEYYDACWEFLDGVERYEGYPSSAAGEAVAAGQERLADKYTPKKLLVRLGISLAVAALVVGIMAFSTQRMSGAAGRYYQKGAVDVRKKLDRFTHTTVVTRKIERNTNSGGGSSSHTGSSGNSHGGSSRGF